MNENKVKMNKPIYLCLLILGINKTVTYEFCYNYIKPKYYDKANLFYMDTDSFTVYRKTKNVYKDVANDVDLTYQIIKLKDPYQHAKTKSDQINERLINVKFMKEFVGRRPKTYFYLIDDGSSEKNLRKQRSI